MMRLGFGEGSVDRVLFYSLFEALGSSPVTSRGVVVHACNPRTLFSKGRRRSLESSSIIVQGQVGYMRPCFIISNSNNSKESQTMTS